MTFRVNFALALFIAAVPFITHDSSAAESGMLDTAAIAQELGKGGELKDALYKISLPRTDLAVTLDGITLKAGFALGTWIAFRSAGQRAVTHGDLVLTEDEVGPVATELERQNVLITGIHNHLLGESPHVMYLHFWGQGSGATLARALKTALALTKTPITQEMPSGEEPFLEAETILKVLGQKGEVKSGVLKVNIPREETINNAGVVLPPTMGMATALNFQTAGSGKVAATGDFVLAAEEVDRVAKALAEHGITITALHNHLVDESPRLYFMHFWAHDTADKVAGGLKAGLAAMKQKKS